MSRHPSTEHLLPFFEFNHLPPSLQEISQIFSDAVNKLLAELEDGPELTVALRHLLDGKDAAVRQRVATLKAAGTPAPKNNPEPELR